MMGQLARCPTELLLDIYGLLDGIDDALHLARSCKRMHAVYDAHRVEILRKIILASSTHFYDVMLCQLQEVYQRFALEYFGRDPDTQLFYPHPLPSTFEQCLTSESVSDQQIWDIVARWQGLRPLQHLYLHPAINERFSESSVVVGDDVLPTTEAVDILDLACNSSGTRDDDRKYPHATPFSNSTANRFYRSLTGCWVAIESRKLADQCSYPFQSTENKTWEKVAAIWQQRADLQESLDFLEVFDFVYGFLCLHIDGVDLKSFTDWTDEAQLYENETRENHANFFIRTMWEALNPADILELLVFSALWKTYDGAARIWCQATRRDYLRVRGFFDTGFRSRAMIRDVDTSPDKFCSTGDLEYGCLLQLQKKSEGRPSEVAEKWKKYRAVFWQTEARGRFGSACSSTSFKDIATESREGV